MVLAYDYVVIGGGMAGGRTCDGIRKLDEKGSIALVAGEAHRPYERPALSKGYLAGRGGLDSVYLQAAEYYPEHRIDILAGVRDARLSPGGHRIDLADGRVLEYKKLCLATGGVARRLSVPGAGLPGVHTLRTIDDCDGIKAAAGSRKRALVVGGSFIGSEVASSLSQVGVDVTMVFPESRLLERLAPPALSDTIRALYEGRGVTIRTGNRPERFEGEDRVARAVLSDGTVLGVDFVVLGVGIDLDTALAREAGLEVGDRGEVIVDEYLQTSAADVYAAGDIAAWPDPTFGRRLRVEHWDVARTQGLRAGRCMAGDVKPYTSLPYFFSDLFDLSFEVWGSLDRWDVTVLRGSLESGSFAIYYFDQGSLTGVLAVGRPDSERKPMQALVKAQPRFDVNADRLPDESIDLQEF